MIIKHILPFIWLCVAAITPAAPVSGAEKTPEQLAQAAAEQWLSLVDSGRFAESWQSAAEYFKAAVSEPQWKSSLDAVRKPLGSLVSRKLKSAKYTKTLPGAPDGEYVILQFNTTFANKKEAVETVTPMLA
ncbi:MAG TPA: DUF4019 domain-containing protein, partial [Chthoniobacterales bacterium]